jgi:hypothetical protein
VARPMLSQIAQAPFAGDLQSSHQAFFVYSAARGPIGPLGEENFLVADASPRRRGLGP